MLRQTSRADAMVTSDASALRREVRFSPKKRKFIGATAMSEKCLTDSCTAAKRGIQGHHSCDFQQYAQPGADRQPTAPASENSGDPKDRPPAKSLSPAFSERLGQRSDFWLAVIQIAQNEDLVEDTSIPRIRITAELRPQRKCHRRDVAVMPTHHDQCARIRIAWFG